MINDINEVWATMNAMYWYKDQVPDQKNYLLTLQRLAIQLDMQGLVDEITDYLNLL